MRSCLKLQQSIDFRPSNLKITNEYYATYERIAQVLDANPRIVNLIHRDLVKPLKCVSQNTLGGGRPFVYTSENLLRILICQLIEGKALRGIVIRIDDSHSLRRFVGIDDGPMMDYTTVCRLKNAIQPKTWQKVTEALTDWAIHEDLISGESLRLDTTAFETSIHWPSDSSLLWDLYRVIARLIDGVRGIDTELVGSRQLQRRRVRRHQAWIARKAGKKRPGSEALKERYHRLLKAVDKIVIWAQEIAEGLEEGCRQGLYSGMEALRARGYSEKLIYYKEMAERVMTQTRRRVFEGETVPATEKIYSIFEPHTELLKRGRAEKPIEFGHMVLLAQVESKFITDYKVFSRKPNEASQVDSILDRHREHFGRYPDMLCADKGFYEGMEKIGELEKRVQVVSIAKKGKRNEKEELREKDALFKMGQMFRAGIEGTISFLKRALGMSRCRNRGWVHYVSDVGTIVLVHNLLLLARGFG